MQSQIIMSVGANRSIAGVASLTQGVYGARGNLELVACDATDGLWVFWFNADSADAAVDTPDVLPGQWSAGLAFASGSRYRDAQIVQSTLGPDHLEVLALTDAGALESWYWSPGPGFQRRGTDAAASVRRFRLAHHDGVLTADVEWADGATAVLSSDTERYPARVWVATDAVAVLDDSAAAEMLDAHGIRDVVDGTARAARSTRDGSTTELTWRDRRGGIRHLGIRD